MKTALSLLVVTFLSATALCKSTQKNIENCNEMLSVSGLDKFLDKGPKGFSVKRVAPNLKSTEKDGPRSYKLSYLGPNSEQMYGHVTFTTDGQVEELLVQDADFNHVNFCDSSPEPSKKSQPSNYTGVPAEEIHGSK